MSSSSRYHNMPKIHDYLLSISKENKNLEVCNRIYSLTIKSKIHPLFANVSRIRYAIMFTMDNGGIGLL